MPGKLDLTLAPWADLDPTGAKGHGIYRDDPYTVVLNFWTDSTKTVGRDMSGGDWQAQIRLKRLPDASSLPAPLAQFAVDTTGAVPAGPGLPGILVISLTRPQTKALALKAGNQAFWEIQDEISGETPLTGKIAVFDDAGRPV